MTYNEFLKKFKKQFLEVHHLSPENLKFYEKGFTSEDQIEKGIISRSNDHARGIESPSLLVDTLYAEFPTINGTCPTLSIDSRLLYEESEQFGYDKAVDRYMTPFGTQFQEKNVLKARNDNDYEALKETLILRPLNYSLHARDLKGCVYRKVSDFTLVLYQYIQNTNGMLMTSKIKRDEVVAWGMADKENEIFQTALENTARLFPARYMDIRTKQYYPFMEHEFTKEELAFSHNRILLTTTHFINGAVVLFYPGVIKKLMQIKGGPFKAVFLSTDDVLIFDKDDPNANPSLMDPSYNKEIAEMLSKRPFLVGVNHNTESFS